MKNKFILGIETSCDDTSVAIVSREGRVAEHVKISQNELSNQYGGIYPEFASRAHILNIIPSIDSVVKSSGIDVKDEIIAIGVTRGPGLIGSLMIGTNTAAVIGDMWNKPVIGVNHLRGHLKSIELEGGKILYPAIVLLVSGGHTFICIVDELGNIHYLGQTRDDSLGEAYDKLGKMLNLPFPAGPKIDQKALKGNPSIHFPSPLLKNGLDFSFSGLKSAVSRYLDSSPTINENDVCASFVKSVLNVLDDKIRRAIFENPSIKSLAIVGGVAASKQVRELGNEICSDYGIMLNLPPIKWATDNGAMIALAAWDYLERGKIIPPFPIARIPIDQY